MCFVLRCDIDVNGEETKTLIGPFNSEQQANSYMQGAFDEFQTDGDRGSEGVNYADDSDAGHFEIQLGNDIEAHWYVLHPQEP